MIQNELIDSSKKQQFHEGYLRLPEVLMLFPVSASTWWEGIRQGIYPSGRKLSCRTTGWRKSDIYDLLNQIDLGDKNAR